MLVRVEDPSSFLLQVVGTKTSLTKEELRDFFLPMIERNLKDYVSNSINSKKLDIYTLDSQLIESSKSVKKSLERDFQRFGVNLIDFYLQGIEVIGSNPEYQKIKESLSDAATLRIRAKAASDTKGFYEKERNLDSIDRAISKNSSGIVGSLLGKSGEKESDSSISNEDLKYKLFNLKDMLNSGLISKEEYEQKKKELLGKY